MSKMPYNYFCRQDAAGIESVSAISRTKFRSRHVLPAKPLKILGGASKWKAVRSWSPAYLRNAIKDTPVALSINSKGVFDYNNSALTGPVHVIKDVRFRDAVDEVLRCSDVSNKFCYIQQHSIREQFSCLVDELDYPPWIIYPNVFFETNLWFGSKGCFSPLHFDRSDNFLVQVHGRKHVTLFAPDDNEFLYQNLHDNLPHCSQINLLTPDLDQFPLFKQATAFSVFLDPGDALYIPKHWWHAVYSLETSISLNYWWMRLPELFVHLLRRARKGSGNSAKTKRANAA